MPAPIATPLPLPFRAFLSFYKAQCLPWRGRLEERAEWLVTVISELRKLESHRKLTFEERATAGILADRLDVLMAELAQVLEVLDTL